MGFNCSNKLKIIILHPSLNFARIAPFKAFANFDFDFEVWITSPEYSSFMNWDKLPFKTKTISGLSYRLAPDRLISINLRLFPLFLKNKPDVIVSLGLSVSTFFAAIYAQIMRKGLVIWSGGTLISEKGITFLKLLWRKFLVKFGDTYLAYGTAARDYLIFLGAAPAKIFISYNVVDNEWWSYHSNPLSYNRESFNSEILNVLFVGQMIKRKRVDLILDLAKLCQDNALKIQFYLVGSGDEKYGYHNYANKLSLKNVCFIERQKPEDLVRYYSLSHVFLLPSQDIWGLVVNEAMACGLVPIISPHVECGVDLIRNGYNGFIEDFDQPEKILIILLKFIADRSYLATISENARNDIQIYSPCYWAEQAYKAVLTTGYLNTCIKYDLPGSL